MMYYVPMMMYKTQRIRQFKTEGKNKFKHNLKTVSISLFPEKNKDIVNINILQVLWGVYLLRFERDFFPIFFLINLGL